MSYQTGTALNLDDLLAKLSVFAAANGWTINKTVAGSGNGASSELYLSKGTSFFTLEAQFVGGSHEYRGVFQPINHHFLDCHGATGFDGGQPADNQPGTHTEEVETNWLLPNMTAFHFFTDPTKTYLHIVVETLANLFRHIHIGQLEKIGAYDGGEYVCGVSWDQNVNRIHDPTSFQHGAAWIFTGNAVGRRQQLRANVDGQNWKITRAFNNPQEWFPPMGHSTVGFPNDDWLSQQNNIKNGSPNTFNSTIILFPMPCYIHRSTTQRAPVGKPHDLRQVNIKNVSPSASIFFGGDEWLLFPMVEKKNPGVRDNLPNSGWLGFAYKKIP